MLHKNVHCQRYIEYSGLPIKYGFNCFLKAGRVLVSRIVAGRLFQVRGPATSKARSPILVLVLGTKTSDEFDDRSRDLLQLSDGGLILSASYWDWLWCPGLSPVLVSIALPFAFHTWCFPFALICHWISIVFLLYGRRMATHSVDPSLTHFLGEFPGLGLALAPDVVVPEAEQRCAWSRKLDPNFCPGRGKTSDLGI